MAREFRYLKRSPKALLTGDAFTARADDNYTLFYNPAGMGEHRGVSFDLLNVSFGATDAREETDRFKDFPDNDASAIADRVLGLPLYLHAGTAPGFKMDFIGFNALLSSTTSILLRNRVTPTLEIDYRYDRGFVAGFGFSVGTKKSSSKSFGTGVRTSFGGAVKYLNREGLQEDFPFFGAEIVDIISSNDLDTYDEIRNALGYSKGTGWGYDVGVLHSFLMGNSKASFGLSVLDIGETGFSRYEGSRKVPDQEMAVNVGTSWTQDFGLLDYTLSVDMHPINQGFDIGRTIKLGAELSIPFFTFMAGWNAGYPSYGVSFSFFFFELTAGFYSVELGNSFREKEGKRGVILLNLFDFSFDV